MPIQRQAADFRFAIAGRTPRVRPDDPIWAEALPLSAGGASVSKGQPIRVTHGDYFQAVQTYLINEGARHLESALGGAHQRGFPPACLAKLNVILEKHGEFYHPARIRIREAKGAPSFVLNVAVTAAGNECMANEIEALRRVVPRLPKGTLPVVYGSGQVEAPGGMRFHMFLADWYENHHEFHLSVDADDGAQKIIVWDTHNPPYYLAPEAEKEVYVQAAYLLTRAYDPASTCQIYPWHHAAGDFVLQQRDGGVRLKLITVRQYAPTLGDGDGQDLDTESRLMAAMVFFANLSLRNRIDRLDGTGALAWAADAAVAATVTGFKLAMKESSLPDLAPLLRSYDAGDWVTLLNAVADQYRLMAAEEPLFNRFIAGHAACLHSAVRRHYRG